MAYAYDKWHMIHDARRLACGSCFRAYGATVHMARSDVIPDMSRRDTVYGMTWKMARHTTRHAM
eukprot:4931221-Lingulodinium_polyedra.AAC.1